MAKTVHIDLFGVAFFILTLVAGYGSYKLWPVYAKRNEIEAMIKVKAYQLKRNEPERVKEAILNMGKKNLGVNILADDIVIRKHDTYVQIEVTWKPVLHLLFGQTYTWPMTIQQRVGVLD